MEENLKEQNGRLLVGKILTLSQSSEGFAVLMPPWFIDMCSFLETRACCNNRQPMYTADFITPFWSMPTAWHHYYKPNFIIIVTTNQSWNTLPESLFPFLSMKSLFTVGKPIRCGLVWCGLNPINTGPESDLLANGPGGSFVFYPLWLVQGQDYD